MCLGWWWWGGDVLLKTSSQGKGISSSSARRVDGVDVDVGDAIFAATFLVPMFHLP